MKDNWVKIYITSPSSEEKQNQNEPIVQVNKYLVKLLSIPRKIQIGFIRFNARHRTTARDIFSLILILSYVTVLQWPWYLSPYMLFRKFYQYLLGFHSVWCTWLCLRREKGHTDPRRWNRAGDLRCSSKDFRCRQCTDWMGGSRCHSREGKSRLFPLYVVIKVKLIKNDCLFLKNPDGKFGLPQSAIDSVNRNQVGLKGPLMTPIGKGHRSLNLALRKEFNLYANVRPCRSLEG